MLFVVDLTGAEPTLEGGGELALDIEADVIEALSEITSLAGVPGRSSLEADAKLGWREGGNVGGIIEVAEDGVALPQVGVSVLGVGITLSVFGVFRDIDDGRDTADGVLGGSGGNADGPAADVRGVSGTPDVFEVDFGCAATFRMPGVGRCSMALVAFPAGIFAVFLFGTVGGWDLDGVALLVEAGINAF